MSTQPTATITLTHDEMVDASLVVAAEVTRLCDLLASGTVPADELDSTWEDRDSQLAVSWQMFDAIAAMAEGPDIKKTRLVAALRQLARAVDDLEAA